MQNDTDSSSGTLSPPSRSSPASGQNTPVLSKFTVADPPSAADSLSQPVARTSPPRTIPLFRLTPTRQSWKQKPELGSPLPLRPSLGVVPSGTQEGEKIAEEKNQASSDGASKGKLLTLLRSKSKIGKFHNVTLKRAKLPRLPRSNTSVAEFISANQSARVRPVSLEKVSKPGGERGFNLKDLKHERPTLNEGFAKNKTFTSNVKSLLQGDKPDKKSSQEKDSGTLKALPPLHNGLTNASSTVELALSNKNDVSVPSHDDRSNQKTGTTVAQKRRFDLLITSDQPLDAQTVSSKEKPKVPRLDAGGAADKHPKGATKGLPGNSKEPDHSAVATGEGKLDLVNVSKSFKTPRNDVMKNQEKQPESAISVLAKPTEVPKRDAAATKSSAEGKELMVKDTKLPGYSTATAQGRLPDINAVSNIQSTLVPKPTTGHSLMLPSVMALLNGINADDMKDQSDDPAPSSSKPLISENRIPILGSDAKVVPAAQNGKIETKSIAEVQKIGQGDKENNNNVNSELPSSPEKKVDSVSAMSIEEKWNRAMVQEPPNNSSQRQALTDLFTKLYQSNMFTRSEDTWPLNADGRQESSLEAKIVTDNRLFSSQNGDNQALISKPREKTHHLKGSVVVNEAAAPRRVNSDTVTEAKKVGKSELHYIKGSESTSSDNDEQAEKGYHSIATKERPREHSVQRPVSHVTLHENSTFGTTSTSGKDHLGDPEIERRKINRQLAAEVMAKLDEQSWFNKKTVMNLVEPGIAKHSSMISHPKVSVTNNICSAENYETSHAYYYQHMHKRSKLEFIPLRGSLAADFGQESKSQPSQDSTDSNLTKQDQPPENRRSEMWRRNWQALLQRRSILFDSSPESSLKKNESSNSKQITQLRRIFEAELKTKVASELDDNVEIIVSCDSSKAMETIENIMRDPLRASTLNKNLRIWSIEKTCVFLENMGINLQEWFSKEENPAKEPTAGINVAQGPFSNNSASHAGEFSPDGVVVNKPTIGESVVKKKSVTEKPVPAILKDKESTIPVDEEQATKKSTVSVDKGQATKESTVSADKEKAAKENAVSVDKEKATKEDTVSVDKEQATKESTVSADKEQAIKEPVAPDPAAEEPVSKDAVVHEPVGKEASAKKPLTEVFPRENVTTSVPITVSTVVDRPVAKINVSKTLSTALKSPKGSPSNPRALTAEKKKLSSIEHTPGSSSSDGDRPLHGESKTAEIVDVDIGKTDTETNSDAPEDELESILQEAADKLDQKDRQIEAARKLILALCQDVMKKELEITALNGRLKVKQKEVEQKDKSIEGFVQSLVQKELQLRNLTKKKHDLAGNYE